MHSLALLWVVLLDFLFFGSALLWQKFKWFPQLLRNSTKNSLKQTKKKILKQGECNFDKKKTRRRRGSFSSNKDHVRECDWNLKSVCAIYLWGMNHTPQLGFTGYSDKAFETLLSAEWEVEDTLMLSVNLWSLATPYHHLAFHFAFKLYICLCAE